MGERVNLEPWREGGTGFEPASLSQPEELPFKLESGTPNTVGIAGLRAGIEFVLSKGIQTIRKHEQKLTGKLINALKDDPAIHFVRHYGYLQKSWYPLHKYQRI